MSLLRTGTYVLGWDLGLQMTLGKVARAESRERNQAPLMNPYRAGDGRWFFLTGLEAGRHIGAVCRALGHPELLEDPRFADATSIRRHRTEVIAILDEIIAEHPWPSGPNGSTRKGSGGLRRRPRRRWSTIPSCWPTTGSWRSTAAAPEACSGR